MGRWKGFLGDKGDPKHQSLQISLDLDLTTLYFNDILIVDFLDIQSKSESRFSECKIGHSVRSWDENSIKGVALMKSGSK